MYNKTKKKVDSLYVFGIHVILASFFEEKKIIQVSEKWHYALWLAHNLQQINSVEIFGRILLQLTSHWLQMVKFKIIQIGQKKLPKTYIHKSLCVTR